MKRPTHTFFHSLHSCGHAVYWQNPRMGMLLGGYPCPWCGGESGKPIPLTERIITHGGHSGLVVRVHNADGAFPVPDSLPCASDDEGVGVQHMTGDVCCRRSTRWPDAVKGKDYL